MQNYSDYILIGSGASGVQAAQTLIEQGQKVLLLDVGTTGLNYDSTLPKMDFEQIRRTDAQQMDYILGKNFEGFGFKKLET